MLHAGNASRVEARVIVEGANGPTTAAAARGLTLRQAATAVERVADAHRTRGRYP